MNPMEFFDGFGHCLLITFFVLFKGFIFILYVRSTSLKAENRIVFYTLPLGTSDEFQAQWSVPGSNSQLIRIP